MNSESFVQLLDSVLIPFTEDIEDNSWNKRNTAKYVIYEVIGMVFR